MTFEVVDNVDAKRVELEFHGVISLDQLQRSLRVAVFYLKAYQWDNVLIDLRQSIPLLSRDEIKQFLLTEGPGINASWKIALLIGESQEEKTAHAEEVAKRFGIDLVVFGSEFTATSWLAVPGSCMTGTTTGGAVGSHPYVTSGIARH